MTREEDRGQESVVALSFEESRHEAETRAMREQRHWGRMSLDHRRAKTLSSAQQPRNSQESSMAKAKPGRSWRVSS